MSDSDRSARLLAVSNNFQMAVRRSQELERSGTLLSWVGAMKGYMGVVEAAGGKTGGGDTTKGSMSGHIRL